MQFAWRFGVVALIALGLVALPGGGAAINLAVTLVTIFFVVAMGMYVYRIYRERRFELDSLEPTQRLVLYGSVGLVVLTLIASNRLFDAGGAGILAWLALLALSSYGLFWVWTKYRESGI